ncbi:MAG: ABC transporter ATP-binding protein [Rhodospirillaceae bacterium]|nr:ABC transporter ATP-binding protein [Rhodospirillaceae bacterium]
MPDAAAAPADRPDDAGPADSVPTDSVPADSVPAVRVRGLTKTYRGSKNFAPSRALKGIDLDIPKGSVFGLLGPNGAGKSTLINILAGLVNKTAGTAAIWGIDIDRDPRRSRSAIGVVPQELNIDAFFTPRELLEFQAGLYGVPARERITGELLAAVQLTDKAENYSRTLSGGMRRRLMVAKAMVHKPPVLVLDEPTAGVDVELRQQLWGQIRALNRSGTTILLTTHYLDEAQELCDRIAFIDHGEVIACDTTEALLRRVDRKEVTFSLGEPLGEPPAGLARYDAEIVPPRRLTIRYRPSRTRFRDIVNDVREAGLTIVDVSTRDSDLEDLFLQLTAAPAEGAGAESGTDRTG